MKNIFDVIDLRQSESAQEEIIEKIVYDEIFTAGNSAFGEDLTDEIGECKQKIEELRSELARTTDKKEIKNIKYSIRLEEKHKERKAKKLRKFRELKKEALNIRYKNEILHQKKRIDGNVRSPKDYEKDICNILNEYLTFLGEKRSNGGIRRKIIFPIKIGNLEKKLEKVYEKMEEINPGAYLRAINQKGEYITPLFLLKEMYFQVSLSTLLAHSDKIIKTLDLDGSIHIPYCEDLLKTDLYCPIDTYLHDLVNSLTSSILEVRQLKYYHEEGLYGFDFQSVENMYREYVKHELGARVIEYIIPQLSKDPIHKSEIMRLENIVKKHSKLANKSKKKADKEYQKIKEKMAQENIKIDELPLEKIETIEPTINLTQDKVKEQVEIVDTNIDNGLNIDSNKTIETKEEEQQVEQKDKLTENELRGLSSGYRARYIGEKIRKTELGELSYSEYLKREYPEQKELIEYMEKQEKEAETIYKEYLKDRAKRVSKEQPIINFKEFVKIRTGIEYEQSDIELTPKMEQELKKIKAL